MPTSPEALPRFGALSPVSFFARESLVQETAFVFAGVVITSLLFLGLSHSAGRKAPAPETPIEDLRAYSLPPEPPPPPPTSTSPAAPADLAVAPFVTGLEASRAASPVQLAVSPLKFDLPPLAVAVPNALSIAQSYPHLKPLGELGTNEQQIYRQTEVDQKPVAVKRSLQFIPHSLRINLYQIRVVLVILMERNGKASSVRVVRSCGVPALDEIVVRSVQEDWEFSPAIKKGKPVRCLLQQAFLIKFDSGSLLEAH